MAILQKHTPLLRSFLDLPGLLASPVLCFGVQDVKLRPEPPPKRPARRAWLRRRPGSAAADPGPPLPPAPEEFRGARDLAEVIRRRGFEEVVTLDHFDPRAQLRYDMNRPVPDAEHERYGTLIDIGCLEHVFDTRQCMENCLRMLRTGGSYLLNTPVRGYYGHGLHSFHPEALCGAVAANGFEILELRYSARDGRVIEDPEQAEDVVIWLAARKTRRIDDFQIPQQGRWRKDYAVEAEDPPAGPA